MAAAGSGAAAATLLSSGINGDGPEAASDLKPEPPSSSPSGRPKGPLGKEDASSDVVEQMWLEIFQGIAERDKPLPKEELAKCAAVAIKFQTVTSEFVSVCLTAGLNEAGVRSALKQNMFRSAPNPQDGDAKRKQKANEDSANADMGQDKSEALDNGVENEDQDVVRPLHNQGKRMSGKVIGSTRRVSAFSMPCCKTKSEKADPAGAPDMKNRRKSLSAGGLMFKHMPGSPSQVYDLGHGVGEGTFGSVCKARHRQTGLIHAVKAVPKYKISEGELWAEIGIMKQLDHPHIMRLYYTFEDEERIYMASEMCSGGELFDVLDSTGFFAERVAAALMRQILGAVNYLHSSKSIAHRDLKPENFLVLKTTEQEMIHLKMIDFGTAKNFKENTLITKVCTAHYVAPEVLKRGEVAYSEKVDCWSCGVILYMLLCGFMPFHADNDKDILKVVKKGKFDFSPPGVWAKISQAAKDLLRRMICKEVKDRCTATEAYKHEWTQKEDSGEMDLQPDDDIVKSMRTFLKHNRLKRVALQIIARQISDDEITKLRNIFEKIDADQSGTLTIEEMDEALVSLEVSAQSRQEMAAIMRSIDVGGSGELEYTEFLAAMLKQEQYLKEDICKGAFHLLDVDGDGVLSARDLESLLDSESGHGKSLSKAAMEEIEQIMSEVDEDGDGGVQFEEFYTLLAENTQASGCAISLRWQRGGGKKEAQINFATIDDEEIEEDE